MSCNPSFVEYWGRVSSERLEALNDEFRLPKSLAVRQPPQRADAVPARRPRDARKCSTHLTLPEPDFRQTYARLVHQFARSNWDFGRCRRGQARKWVPNPECPSEEPESP